MFLRRVLVYFSLLTKILHQTLILRLLLVGHLVGFFVAEPLLFSNLFGVYGCLDEDVCVQVKHQGLLCSSSSSYS